jgi:hypothetical protein
VKRTLTVKIALAYILIAGAAQSDAHERPLRSPLAVMAAKASTVASMLLEQYPEMLDTSVRQKISSMMETYSDASNKLWLRGSTKTAISDEEADKYFDEAEPQFRSAALQMLVAAPLIRNAIDIDSLAAEPNFKFDARYGTPLLVLYRHTSDDVLACDFDITTVTPDASKIATLDLGGEANAVRLVELKMPFSASRTITVVLTRNGSTVYQFSVTITMPSQSPLSVEVLDTDGKPVEAAVGLYSEEGKLLIPDSALDFTEAGYAYLPSRYRDRSAVEYWPGGKNAESFFIRGTLQILVPDGDYSLFITRGPEYKAFSKTISIRGKPEKTVVQLERWIDMYAKGWVSGDCHIHYARPDKQADGRLLLWTKAEDLRIGNVLRMGDARRIYFPQYAFGKQGSALDSGFALVPGQEDPRTAVLGHSISLNIKTPIRSEEHYYLYSDVFDEAHRQGGITGHAHVSQELFLVNRDMSLNIPRGKIDFEEIAEFGKIEPRLYYEFLNLGFHLAAVAGSDAPWGGSVGDSRVYAYTGTTPNPDRWFDAVRHGHTFVTSGAILEFRVDGKIPGDVISLGKRATVSVEAVVRRGSPLVRIDPLEIVVNGEVIRSFHGNEDEIVAKFPLEVDQSIWIAARTSTAHTTPVYIEVAGHRTWKLDAVHALITKRLDQLGQLDHLIDTNAASMFSNMDPEWENPDAFRAGSEKLRGMIEEAREIYRKLDTEATEQLSQR